LNEIIARRQNTFALIRGGKDERRTVSNLDLGISRLAKSDGDDHQNQKQFAHSDLSQGWHVVSHVPNLSLAWSLTPTIHSFTTDGTAFAA
jgi:hypothetical protein